MTGRRIAIALVWAAVTATAQQIPFQLLVTQGQNAVVIANASTLTFLSAVGQSQVAQVKATYTGTGTVTISQAASVIGSTAFRATIVGGTLPLTLTASASVTISIQFTPASTSASTAQISLPYQETAPTGSISSGAIALSLDGESPSFTLSYILQTDQNVVALQAGGTIPFVGTLVGTTAQAALNLTNTGSGPGTVTNITSTGSSAFRLQGKPLFPASVASNANLQVFVLYTPTAVGADTGQITITFDTGTGVTINLTGSGSAPGFTYQLLNVSPPETVAPGGAIAVPDVNVGQTSSVTVRVLNSGNASGTVNSISVAGQGFQLSAGTATPQTLAPNASLTFTVTFTPAQPGALTGTLIVNADTFKLTGNGLGSQLVFSYVAGGSTITLGGTNNSVVFSPVMITQSGQLSLDVKNTGTLATTISNIGVGQANGPYTVTGVPPLPVTLAPNGDFQITLQFTPVTVGFTNGTLVLDATTLTLIGQGTQPPALAAYTLSGPSGTAAPMSQPSVGLSLASAYPVAVAGTLTMSVTGTLPADPAVQFASGGRTVSFVIPANQTAAVFGAQGTQIGLQTGTVAETIALTPTFATQAGNVDLTPTAPAGLQFAVAPAAPALIALQLTNLTATGLTLQVTGFATTRSLTTLAVQFTAATGFSMPVSQFSVDVKQVSTVWFASAASQAFGGQFTISVPFTFQGAVPTGTSVLNAIASVSVSLSNATGTSNPLQAAVP